MQYASDRLRDNKEIILEAVKINGWALKYASPRLKDNKEVVMEAIKNDEFAVMFASDRLKNDRDIANECLSRDGMTYSYLGNEITGNSEKEIIKNNPWEKASDKDNTKSPWEAKVNSDKDNQWER